MSKKKKNTVLFYLLIKKKKKAVLNDLKTNRNSTAIKQARADQAFQDDPSGPHGFFTTFPSSPGPPSRKIRSNYYRDGKKILNW